MGGISAFRYSVSLRFYRPTKHMHGPHFRGADQTYGAFSTGTLPSKLNAKICACASITTVPSVPTTDAGTVLPLFLPLFIYVIFYIYRENARNFRWVDFFQLLVGLAIITNIIAILFFKTRLF